METKYINRQRNLQKAEARVKAKLNSFADYAEKNLHKPFNRLTDEQKEAVRAKINTFNWNRYHDMENNIENRLKDNWSRFKDWHFDKHGFNTY